jgi:hypothetical protein
MDPLDNQNPGFATAVIGPAGRLNTANTVPIVLRAKGFVETTD